MEWKTAAPRSTFPGEGAGRRVAGAHGIGQSIYSFTADSPTGPWNGRRLAYTTLESGGNIITYNAKEHPQYSTSSNVFLTYNVNSFDYSDLMSDVHIYRPRFVEAP